MSIPTEAKPNNVISLPEIMEVRRVDAERALIDALEAQDYRTALVETDRLLRFSVKPEDKYNGLGYLYQAACCIQDNDLAAEAMRQRMVIEDSSPIRVSSQDSRRQLGHLLLRQGNFTEAEALFSKARNIDERKEKSPAKNPDLYEDIIGLVTSLQGQNKHRAAIDNLRRADESFGNKRNENRKKIFLLRAKSQQALGLASAAAYSIEQANEQHL